MHYIRTILLITGLFWVSVNLRSQNLREQTKISRTFKIIPSGTLDISNKYGSIYVDTWEKDSVKVNLEFIISEKNETRFRKIKNNVNFDFSGNNLYRTVKTQYGSNYSSLFKDLKEATNLFSSNEAQTHVDYYITIPNYINLKINNKYGNIILPSLIGDVNIQLINGDLQARDLNGNNILDLAFGNAHIKTIDRGNLTLDFMETRISKGNKLTIESKSSNINIEETNLLKINAKRGKIEGNKIDYLIAETEFCELSFDQVNFEANLNMKYGVLKSLSCSSGYKTVKITSENADIYLHLPNKDDFLIKTYYLKASLNSDKHISWNKPNVIDEKGTIEKTGYYLKENSHSNMIINISNADLNIE